MTTLITTAKETKKCLSLAKYLSSTFFHNIPGNYGVNLRRLFTVTFIDIDECKQDNICKNGRCMNDPGSFKCVCDRGFTPSSDGKACLGKIAGPLLLGSYIYLSIRVYFELFCRLGTYFRGISKWRVTEQ